MLQQRVPEAASFPRMQRVVRIHNTNTGALLLSTVQLGEAWKAEDAAESCECGSAGLAP